MLAVKCDACKAYGDVTYLETLPAGWVRVESRGLIGVLSLTIAEYCSVACLLTQYQPAPKASRPGSGHTSSDDATEGTA